MYKVKCKIYLFKFFDKRFTIGSIEGVRIEFWEGWLICMNYSSLKIKFQNC